MASKISVICVGCATSTDIAWEESRLSASMTDRKSRA